MSSYNVGRNQGLDLNAEVARYRQRAVAALEVTFLFASALLFFFVEGSLRIQLAILFGGLLSAIALWLSNRGHQLPATLILGGQFLAVPTYLAFISFGTFDSAVLMFPAGVIAMAVVSKPKFTAAFSVVMMFCVAFLSVATFKNWTGRQEFFPLVADNPIDVITVAVLAGFSCMVAVYVSVIMTRLLNTLAEHQDLLEERILKRTVDLERSNSELMLAVERLDGARAELVRGEKLAGLGSLVAGVAHELNTPIGNIAVVATTLSAHVNEFQQMVQAGTLKKSDLQRFLEICVEGVGMLVSTNQRAVDLVASFKQVAVDQTSERRRTFDLELTLSDLLRSIRPSFKGDDWHIESQVEADIALDSYPGPLGQVISNLVQNAIRHGFADRTEGTVKVLAHRLGNDQVEIQVQDDGAGISAQNLKKIFDPFFTTRLGQGGSGLGLTIVHNLVTSTLGGQVEVTSVEGVGTTFTLRLPLSAPNLQQATQA